MARFDVFANSGPHIASTPYLLDVQSDLLGGLDSRVVIPLRRLSHFAPVKLPENLIPVFSVNGEDCLLETPKMAAVPLRVLKAPIASLADQQERVVAAMDFLFNGY
jgi:toxin CcdB